MIEADSEATEVWSHKARIVMFLSAMRHFAEVLKDKKYKLTYVKESKSSIVSVLKEHIQKHQFTHLVCVEPGEWRLRKELQDLASELEIYLTIAPDDHFY
jgi:deoxyribodipyrimidine photolyase-related protein